MHRAAVVLVFVTTFASSASASANQACVGDCDGSGTVTVEEIVVGVNIALDLRPTDQCPGFDCNDTGRVTIDCIVKAVAAALNGCGAVPISTPTLSSTPTATNTVTPTSTRVPIDEGVLGASIRVTTEPILRLFDIQTRIGTPGGVPGRSTVSGCQQFDCVAVGQVTGTEEDCCRDGVFTQAFSDCTFDGDDGRLVRLSGVFVLQSDGADVCTGEIPVGASFTASLNSFTHDVYFPDRTVARTFREITEVFEAVAGGCDREQQLSGFGIRGDGRRFIHGRLQEFLSDGSGTVLVNTESNLNRFEMAVGSTHSGGDCTVTAALNGAITNADFRTGTQFTTDFSDFQIVEHSATAAVALELNGTVGTDCLGPVTLSTAEPLRVASGDTCFTSGRLEAHVADGRAAGSYSANGGVDLDLGADGSIDRQFITCTDVPADQCDTNVVGLCVACSTSNECQAGLSCFPCSGNCSGNIRRCSPFDAIVTCEDGIF